MKRIVLSLTMLLAVATWSFSQGEAPAKKGPVMSFESTTVDYGTIEQDSDPLREVKFTNTGDEPLIITNARGSCGCTVPDWPKEPIMPGESSKIEVRYSTNRIGPFNKNIRISTNENNDGHSLTVKGKVLKKEDLEGVPGNEKKNPMLPGSEK
jgi:hypothetical protein